MTMTVRPNDIVGREKDNLVEKNYFKGLKNKS